VGPRVSLDVFEKSVKLFSPSGIELQILGRPIHSLGSRRIWNPFRIIHQVGSSLFTRSEIYGVCVCVCVCVCLYLQHMLTNNTWGLRLSLQSTVEIKTGQKREHWFV
jgi:hypothetical protein